MLEQFIISHLGIIIDLIELYLKETNNSSKATAISPHLEKITNVMRDVLSDIKDIKDVKGDK